jgi:hypothetical protein
MNVDIREYAVSNLSQIAADLTPRLVKAAKSLGWPKKYAAVLTVTADGTQLTIEYPEEYAKAIEDLEYGTEGISPLPVFRKFLDSNQNYITSHLVDSSLDYLFNEGVLP